MINANVKVLFIELGELKRIWGIRIAQLEKKRRALGGKPERFYSPSFAALEFAGKS